MFLPWVTHRTVCVVLLSQGMAEHPAAVRPLGFQTHAAAVWPWSQQTTCARVSEQACISFICCSDSCPPISEGHSRWTGRLWRRLPLILTLLILLDTAVLSRLDVHPLLSCLPCPCHIPVYQLEDPTSARPGSSSQLTVTATQLSIVSAPFTISMYYLLFFNSSFILSLSSLRKFCFSLH